LETWKTHLPLLIGALRITLPTVTMDSLMKLLKAYREATHLDQKRYTVDGIARIMGPKLHRYISATCPRDAVDDLVQIALVGIAQGLPKFRGATEFEHWCFSIARHKCVDYLAREGKRKPELFDEETLWELIEASARNNPLTIAQRVTLKEALDMVASAKPPCRDYLEMRFIYGMEFEELGETCGLTADAARMAVKRCIQLAQSLVKEKGAAHA